MSYQFNTNIPHMVKQLDGVAMWRNGGKLADEWLERQKNAEMDQIQAQTQGIENSDDRFREMIGLAKQSKRSKWLIDDINAMQSAQKQAQLANQAKMADINKTMSETNKNNATATDTMVGVGNKRLSMLRPAHEILAQTGQTAQAMKYLDYARASGAIDDDTYQAVVDEFGAWADLSPDEVKALGFAYAKGTLDPQYNWQTANNRADNDTKLQMNALDNETSRLNNQNTVNAQMYGHDLDYQQGMAKIEQDDRHHQDNISLKQAEQALQSQQGQIHEAGGLLYFVDKTGNARMMTNEYGQPLTSKEANSLRQAKEENKARMEKLDLTIKEVGNLIQQSTGSGIGAGVDWLGRQFGVSTKGGEAIKQLQVLAGALVAEMPKMSGPQSDKDVELYKQMAGDIANPTIPITERMLALDTIKRLNEKYAGHAGVTLPSQKQQQNQPVKTVNNPYQYQQQIDSAGSKWGIE